MAPAVREPLLGYHPCSTGFLTCARDPGGGQCQAGSLTGAVASKKGIGGRSRSPQDGWKTIQGVQRQGDRLDCDTDGWSRYEMRLSDPGGITWDCHRSTDKSYPGDNRLITPKSSHRRSGLAPRCRLIASWGCSRSQGLGCSPIKAVRELGSERRETVRSLSGVGVGYLRGAVLREDRDGLTVRWWTGCHANGTAG